MKESGFVTMRLDQNIEKGFLTVKNCQEPFLYISAGAESILYVLPYPKNSAGGFA